MLNKKQLTTELGFSLSLKSLVGAYQEISAIRMRRVKKSVLDAREYLSDLGTLYKECLSFYRNYTKQKKKSVKETDKSLFILITSNTGLFGPVMRDTYDLFHHDVSQLGDKSHTDLIILGRLGKRWFDDSRLGISYKFYDISDTGRNDIVLQRIMQAIVSYTNVIVYHSFFESVSTQKPMRTVLSGSSVIFDTVTNDTGKALPEYSIYEPSIETIIKFFEDQIISILFEQSLYESDLGKYASRMISLEKSYLKIDEYVKSLRLLTRKMRSKEFNSTQQNLLSTVISWK